MYKVRWTVKQRDAFVVRFLKFRERYAVTQVVVAESLGISLATVNRIERGKFVPRDETVEKFAELEKRYAEAEKTERELRFVPGGEI